MSLAYVRTGAIARRTSSFSPTSNVIHDPTVENGNSLLMFVWGYADLDGIAGTDNHFTTVESGWTTLFDVQGPLHPTNNAMLRQAAYYRTSNGTPAHWHVTTGGAFANAGSEWNAVIHVIGQPGPSAPSAIVGNAGVDPDSSHMVDDSSNSNLTSPSLTNLVAALAGAFVCRYSLVRPVTTVPSFATTGPGSPGGHGFIVRNVATGYRVNASFATKAVPTTGAAVPFPTWANATDSQNVMLMATSSMLADLEIPPPAQGFRLGKQRLGAPLVGLH